MNNLLIVIPMCCDDAPIAERLLDWIYQLNGRQPKGHVLLAYAHDNHAEMRLKTKIAAELAFESVSEFQATSKWLNLLPGQTDPKTDVELRNNLWSQSAHHVAATFRWPWLWCPATSVPLKPDWIEKLSNAYNGQPKKFMGRRMKRMAGTDERIYLHEVAVYHPATFLELGKFVGSPPFEWATEAHVIPRTTSSRLIQPSNYEGDINTVQADAVLLHGDRTGKLIEQLREKVNEQLTQCANGTVTTQYNPYADLGRAQSVEVKYPPPDGGVSFASPQSPPEAAKSLGVLEPPDKRTKAWKDWNAKRQLVNKA